MSKIELKSVICQADDRVIINDISITLDNRRTVIIGANGSGKSTFIRLLNGLILPDQGEVFVDTLCMTKKKSVTKIRKEIGFMFQNPEHQIIWPMVKEDLAFSLKNHGFPRSEFTKNIDDILEVLEISYLKEALAHEISGGERQLVALAALLIINPQWLIFDEPTAMLDLAHALNIKKIIQDLKQQIVVVTHDLEWAACFERVIWIDQGQIKGDGDSSIVELYRTHILSTLSSVKRLNEA